MKVVTSILFGALSCALLALPTAASAVTFQGTAAGSWQNVHHFLPTDVYTVSNKDKGNTANFNWGTTDHCFTCTSFDNRFTFDGKGSDAGDAKWSATVDQTFLLGDFTYRNGTTQNVAGIEGVDLLIDLALSSPISGSSSFVFQFDITNTPNIGGPDASADIVSIRNQTASTSFIYQGVEYTLWLLGFSTDGGKTIKDFFASREGSIASAGLYGRISARQVDVPEPASLVLFGAGLLGVYRTRRRRA